MTRYEVLEALASAGEDSGSDYHDGLDGWFGWTLKFQNGDLMLTARFEDAETSEKCEFEWVLTPAEVRRNDRG